MGLSLGGGGGSPKVGAIRSTPAGFGVCAGAGVGVVVDFSMAGVGLGLAVVWVLRGRESPPCPFPKAIAELSQKARIINVLSMINAHPLERTVNLCFSNLIPASIWNINSESARLVAFDGKRPATLRSGPERHGGFLTDSLCGLGQTASH